VPFADRSRLPFAVLFSLRFHLHGNRALALFTLLAVATSVALASGLEMATRSIQLELSRTADSLAGAARLEISAGGVGVPEDLLEAIQAVEGVRVASPLVLATFRVPLPDGSRLALRVLGVDFLSDQDVRGYSLEAGDVEIRDEIRLISQLDSLIVTRALAERLDLEVGESLPVLTPAGPLQAVVRGILRPGGVADAYGSQIAAMDVYALQEHLGRAGSFDRIDIVPDDGADLDALHARLESVVRGIASVRRPDSRNEFADQVFGTVSGGIWGIAAIGVLVASLLSYGAISLSVDARLREFALLQAAGLEARRVRRMVRVDVGLLTGLGTALGLGLGRLLAETLFGLLAQLSAENAGSLVHGEALRVTPATLWVALAVGLIVSFAASAEPAWRATSHRPLDVLRQCAARPPESRGRAGCIASSLLAAAVLGLLPLPVPAALRVALLYLGGVGALIATTGPIFLPLLLRASRRWQDAAPSLGALLGQSLVARPAQTALTLGILAAVVAGLVAIAVVLASIERSFADWVGSRYRGGIVITAGDPYDLAQRDPISPETIAAIRSAEGIGEVLESVHAPIWFRGEQVILFARTMSVLAERGELRVLERRWPEVAAELVAGKIAVSDAFQRRFGLSPGDRLALDSPSGPQEFEVAAVVRDYYGASGSLHLDLERFDAHWDRPGASSIVVWPQGDPESVISSIRGATAEHQLLFFAYSDDYSRWVMRPFERFISLLYVVSAFTLVLGGLAILTLMAGAVRQRERELAMLRISGATSGLLSLLVVADSLILVGHGVASGAALGLLCSWPMCAVLTEWLGWTVEWRVAWLPLAGIAALAFAAALLSAAYPAALVRGTRPISAVVVE
jgi:putative ABC transport system permease protein